MFNELLVYNSKIITCISIIGFEEKEIINLKKEIYEKGKISCLYCLPEKEKEKMNNEIIFDMIFPKDKQELKYIIDSPKFFSLTLTDEYGTHSYLYCLELPEFFPIDNKELINIPLTIIIKSYKYDYDAFKNLLYIIQNIISSNEKEEIFDNEFRNNCKKVELLNLFYYCIFLIKPAPHTNIKFSIQSEFLDINKEDINFYFSSNCEIPCNENDPDINILFYTLDQSIIVKLIISMLMERQIIIRSSHSNLLHLIMPAILKLIFPFKWIHSYIPVLPYIDLLEKPGTYLFGVLSDSISFEKMMNEYPGRVVIDCDTNEIFGDYNFQPFNFNKVNELGYGNNLIFIDNNSRIYKIDKNQKKIKINWNYNLINIDGNNSQVIFNSENDLIDRKYFIWLRKNIQILKNPEIFNIGNLNDKKNKKEKNEDESPINLNRPLSYNMQNIFLNFIKKITNDKEHLFYKEFEKTNLYAQYNEYKKYESDSGYVILQNIEATKNNIRCYHNAFIINFVMKNFPSKEFIELLNIQKNNPNYHKLVEIFQNYKKLNNYNHNSSNSFNEINTILNSNVYKSFLATNKNKKHFENINSFYEENKFNKSFNLKINQKKPFLFYSENGFINFLNTINNFCQEQKINLNSIILYNNIQKQIENILIKKKIIVKNNNNEFEIGNSLNVFIIENDILNKKNINQNNINIQNNEQIFENNNKIINISINSMNNSNSSIINIDQKLNNNSKQNSFISNQEIINQKEKINNEEDIINFIHLENDNQYNLNFSHNLQYFLYIVYLLEDIKSNNEYAENLLKKYPTINLNSLIIQLYIIGYEEGDKKEYPFHNFYSFLNQLKYEDLKKITIIEEKHMDLFNIYTTILNEKKKKNEKEIIKLNNSQKSLLRINQVQKSYIEQISTFELFDLDKEVDFNPLKTLTNPNILNLKNNFDYINKKIVVNDYKNKIFETHGYPNINFYFSHLPNMIFNSMPSLNDIKTKTITQLLNETSEKMKNTGIIEIISELRLFNPIKLKTVKERAIFWINIFNSLFLFTVFYYKVNLTNENEWKKFFKNIFFDIGGYNYSFNDIQYIIFNKLIFSSSKYKPEEYVKESSIYILRKERTMSSPFLMVNDLNRMRNNNIIIEPINNLNEDIYISYFSLYIPNLSTLYPKIFSLKKINEEMRLRDKEHFIYFIHKDNNDLYIHELIFKVEKKFIEKDVLQNYIDELDKDMYFYIKNKKYKNLRKTKIKWQLDFSLFHK